MLINLHAWSETYRHRDICASPSRQEAAASPSPTQLTERLSLLWESCLSWWRFLLCVLSMYTSHHFPCVAQALLHTFCDFFNALPFRTPFLLFHYPHLTPTPPPSLSSKLFFPFQKGFPHIHLSLIRSLCIYPNISSHPKYSNAFVFCAQRVVCVYTSVYMYACMRMC